MSSWVERHPVATGIIVGLGVGSVVPGIGNLAGAIVGGIAGAIVSPKKEEEEKDG